MFDRVETQSALDAPRPGRMVKVRRAFPALENLLDQARVLVGLVPARTGACARPEPGPRRRSRRFNGVEEVLTTRNNQSPCYFVDDPSHDDTRLGTASPRLLVVAEAEGG